MSKQKLLFILLFFITVVTVFAGTEYKDLCRKILYAVNPVEAIGKLDQKTFQDIRRYAIGLTVEGQEPLNENDAFLMLNLYGCELARRTKKKDDFSLYLQEKHETLAKYIKDGDLQAIKVDGWIDLFKLDLIFAK